MCKKLLDKQRVGVSKNVVFCSPGTMVYVFLGYKEDKDVFWFGQFEEVGKGRGEGEGSV
jgi:hypothetical protein